jgi:hypothetical protein
MAWLLYLKNRLTIFVAENWSSVKVRMKLSSLLDTLGFDNLVVVPWSDATLHAPSVLCALALSPKKTWDIFIVDEL